MPPHSINFNRSAVGRADQGLGCLVESAPAAVQEPASPQENTSAVVVVGTAAAVGKAADTAAAGIAAVVVAGSDQLAYTRHPLQCTPYFAAVEYRDHTAAAVAAVSRASPGREDTAGDNWWAAAAAEVVRGRAAAAAEHQEEGWTARGPFPMKCQRPGRWRGWASRGR